MKNICTQGFKVSAQDRKALDHFLIVEPKEWAQSALNGMINKASKTILKEWLDKFKEQAETIPADKAKLIPLIVAMPEFKPYNRDWGNLIKAKRKQSKDTEIWSGGFEIEDWEETALNAYYSDYVQDLYNLMENKQISFIYNNDNTTLTHQYPYTVHYCDKQATRDTLDDEILQIYKNPRKPYA